LREYYPKLARCVGDEWCGEGGYPTRWAAAAADFCLQEIAPTDWAPMRHATCKFRSARLEAYSTIYAMLPALPRHLLLQLSSELESLWMNLGRHSLTCWLQQQLACN